MSDEEKKAIKETKNALMKITLGIDVDFDINILDTLLNLIQKQQEEIEIQKDNYENLSADVSSIAKELGLEKDAAIDEIYVAIRILKSKRVNMFEQLDCIEKKDKIIDEMAEHIVSSAIVDDTVCSIKCDCETDILEDCTHEKMLNCTKQYFTKEVEDKYERI